MVPLLERVFRWLGSHLMAPWFRYSIPAFSLRALFQPVHGEDAMEQAVLLLAVNAVPGDCVEFGVFEGRSLLHTWACHRWVAHLISSGQVAVLAGASTAPLIARRFFGFDSFEGLPEPGPEGRLPGQEGWITKGAFARSETQVRAELRRSRVDETRVRLVPGWYTDTLTEATRTELLLEKVALVHIDCDLYESAKAALAFVGPLLEDGAIIVFDDWWLYRGRPEAGEQRAFAEWLAEHPQWRATELFRGTTVSFLLHRIV